MKMFFAALLLAFTYACGDPCPTLTYEALRQPDGTLRKLPDNADAVTKTVWRELLNAPEDTCPPPNLMVILPTDSAHVQHITNPATGQLEACLSASHAGDGCATGIYEPGRDIVQLLSVPGDVWYHSLAHEYNHALLMRTKPADFGDPYHTDPSWQKVDGELTTALLTSGL